MSCSSSRGLVRRLAPFLLGICVVAAGCSKGSTDEAATTDQVQEKVTLSLGAVAVGVPVAAGTPTYLAFTLALPPEEAVTAWNIDVVATLAKVHVTPASLRMEGVTAAAGTTLVVGLSQALPPSTPCDASVTYTDFTVTLDPLYLPVAATPTSVGATPAALALMAAGPFTICARVTFPISAMVTVDSIVADVTRTCATAPANFSGGWGGTYSCATVQTCSNYTSSGDVTIDISRDEGAKRWVYVDGPFRYEGSVCGNVFRFVRNDSDEIERGTMTIDAANRNSATKQSRYWARFNVLCYGDCTDHLTRQ